MGQFAEVLHLGPREVKELSIAEFEALADYLAQREQDIKAASKGR